MAEWIAIWSAVQAVGTIAATAVAAYQIHALRRDQKAWPTLEACERYERDPTLTKICECLRDARDKGKLDENPRPFRLEASTLLNYCDGIAIGVVQKFYVEKIVKDHLAPIIRDHVEEFLSVKMAPRIGIDPKSFSRFCARRQRFSPGLHDKWRQTVAIRVPRGCLYA
jgi:hypothetical protein